MNALLNLCHRRKERKWKMLTCKYFFKLFWRFCRLAVSALASGWSPVGLNLISVVASLDSCFEPSAVERSSRRLFARASSFDSSGCAPFPLSVERFSRRDLQFLMELLDEEISGEEETNVWKKQRNRRGFQLRGKRKEKRDHLISVCFSRERSFWLLRCWREFVAAPSAGFVDELFSVLIRLIFKICRSSLTADCGILNVLAQSKISWTVMSAELLSCVLLVKSSSNGSSLMFINSSTCWWSSLVRVIVMGTETTEEGVGDGGTICVLLVIIIVLSFALRFFKLTFSCLLIGVIVISLFSISLRICFHSRRRENRF